MPGPRTLRGLVIKLFHFAYQEALCCIFPVAIFATLAVTKTVDVPYLHRYDVILLVCLLIQAGMYFSGLETRDELKVIGVFHLIGLMLELFKTQHGSWAYPEDAWTKVPGVPLYSGFMYASVASYICQAWRRLQLELSGWPRPVYSVALSTAIYLNFFSHHYIVDLRWPLTGLIFVVYWRTWVGFAVQGSRYRMPLVLAFFLVGFFVWIAENIATFFNAWEYPHQRDGWHLVHLSKINAWFLLVIISFIIVAQLRHVKAELQRRQVVRRSVPAANGLQAVVAEPDAREWVEH